VEREAFLARVRDAGRTSVLPPHPSEDPGLHVPELDSVDLLALFVARLEEVEASVHEVADHDQARHAVIEIARGHAVKSFMIWDDDQMPVRGVGPALTAAGLAEIAGRVDSDSRLEQQMGYLELGLGVTGAEAGFAESGTFVLRSGPGRPRMASVIPLVHVALLERDRLHRSLAHWAVEGAPGIADAANVVFITGPSRTADIEQHINVGVHGPRYVHVVLL
jgi:L-lactate dehydrogenase complex protein LldG